MDFNILKQNLQQPFQQSNWKEWLLELIGSQFSIESKAEKILVQKGNAKSIERFASIALSDDKNIAVLDITTSADVQIARNRVALRDIAFNLIDQDKYHGLLVFYHSEDAKQLDYRMSFISSVTTIDEEGNFSTQSTQAKRYSFLLGANESCTTAALRLLELHNKLKPFKAFESSKKIALKDINEAFSVEKLNNEFFKKYKDIHYKNFCDYILQKDDYAKVLINKDEESEDKKTKPIRDFVKKMLGRIVFLHFLQKKGWLGCSADSEGWNNGDKNFMQNLFTNFANQTQFYSQCLTVLFFQTLNTDRRNQNSEAPKALALDKNTTIKIPFLNGGLFDDDQPETNSFDFPVAYFNDLFEFFSQYNFTIDENSPEEQEVGIDPEMLGHIFENLLEENKDKGAFYTPKEIVHYMCQESLIQYLRTHLPECADNDSEATKSIELFIRKDEVGNRTDKKNFVVANAKRIEAILDKVKICDPAIGSGAFPMGMLQEIFKAKMTLDLTLDKSKVKKEIIQNSIYGVDIERGAVDIARLRFWLSLVVDEDTPQPLPNLDYKIMQGNSLLESFEGIDLSNLLNDKEDEPIIYAQNEQVQLFAPEKQSIMVFEAADQQQLQDLIHLYFDFEEQAQSQYQTKQEVKQAINTIVEGKLKAHFYIEQQKQESKLKDEQKKLLANTIHPTDPKGIVDKKTKANEKLQKDIDAITTRLGELKSILNKLSQWEQSDKERPYFLWHTYFKDVFDQGGFDIVIGNPPYLRIQGIRDYDTSFANQLVAEYKSASGSFDLYVIFLEKSFSLINSNGIVNYIMPTKWTNAAFGKGIRVVITEKNAASKIVNFGAYQVFNASTYTGLQWFKFNSPELSYFELDRNLQSNIELENYLKLLSKNQGTQIPSDKLTKEIWTLTAGGSSKIIDKLNLQPRRISDVFEKIFQGLATSKDDVYFLYNCIDEDKYIIGFSKQLDKSIKIERGFVKPLLKGEDVHRYDNITSNRFVVFPYRLENGNAELYKEDEIKMQFPLAYSYLKECENVLRDREKGRFNIDGEWFQFGRKQGINFAEKEKLVAPEISFGGNFTYDKNGRFYSSTTIYGYIRKEGVTDSYKSLLAILNSQLFWWYLVNTGTVLSNGYFRFKTNYILPFPMPNIPNKTALLLEQIVDEILDVKTKNKNANTKKLEEKINEIVYNLYNLMAEEIELIQQV